MFKKIAANCILLFLIWNSLSAQAPKKVEYYPSGKKKFEGNYVLKLPNMELSDYSDDTMEELLEHNANNSRLDALNASLYINPYKCYHGHCIFYYKEGYKRYEGNYEQGSKEGKFIYYYLQGHIASEQYYKNGMPDSTWTYWHESGKIASVQNYKAIPQNNLYILDSIYNVFLKTYFKKIELSYYTSQEKDKLITSNRIIPIRKVNYENELCKNDKHKFITNLFDKLKGLPKNTMLDGDFTYYDFYGSKTHAMHFKNNEPIGTWEIWNTNKKKLFSMTFKNNEIVDVKDVSPDNSMNKEFPEDNYLIKDVEIIKQEPTTEIYRIVEQLAEFPGGEEKLQEFISSNLQYPKKAKRKNIKGKVLLEVLVNTDGALSDIKVIEGLGFGCDEEAIHIVQAMPKWYPYKQGGKSVKSYIKIPIVFSL